MVYETDFYTTRRPYRASPSLSTYTITSEPSRQVRLLPGLGKVHVVHTYDRIVPYIGHKRLTVVTTPPVVVRVRPSTLYREFDRIENKLRPITYNSYTNDYLNSDSHVRILYVRNPISSSYPVYRPSTLYTSRYYPSYYSPSYYSSYAYYPSYENYYYPYYTPTLTTRYHSTYRYYPSYRWLDLALFPSWRYNAYARTFDDETRSIRAQTASILQRIHDPVPRKVRSLPLPYVSRYEEVPARLANDNYIHRMLLSSPSNKSTYTTYSTDPVKKYFGQGHLACVTLCGEKAHPRRRNVYVYQDPVRNDIQLLSYYINRFRDEKAVVTKSIKVPRQIEDVPQDKIVEIVEDFGKGHREARMAKIMAVDQEAVKADAAANYAQDRAKREAATAAKKDSKKDSKKIPIESVKSEAPKDDGKAAEEAAKKAADEAAAKKAAEEAAAKKAEEEAAASKAAEAAKKDAEAKAKKDADAAAKKKADEAAAKKEKEAKEAAEKAAEAERFAEQAKQEELAKQAEIEKAKKDEEERLRLEEEKRLAEAAKAEEEKQQLLRLEEIARQAEDEKEAELARQADELAELARQEAELAEQAKKEEEAAEQERKEADHADLEKKEAELEELESKEKELSEIAKQEAEAAEKAAQEADEAKEAAEKVDMVIYDDPAEEESTPIVEEPQTPEESVSEPVEAAVEEVQE